jgi:squalene synthase HpnC
MNRAADVYCAAMLRHYENFTVASRLAPRALRRDLARVYAFARTTDDLGDESGDHAVALRRLERWREDVMALFAGEAPVHPVLIALQDTVRRHSLPPQPFFDLIDANVQDQRVSAYEDWPALLGYCRLSAAPVGRLVLRLSGINDTLADALSDDVCIGLQLANFAQDVSVDSQRGRTYLLREDIRRLGERGAVRAMCERARALLASGRELEAMVSGRMRVQLALYRLGGEAILDAIARAQYDTEHVRPTVGNADRARIVISSLLGLSRGRRVLSSQGPLRPPLLGSPQATNSHARAAPPRDATRLPEVTVRADG